MCDVKNTNCGILLRATVASQTDRNLAFSLSYLFLSLLRSISPLPFSPHDRQRYRWWLTSRSLFCPLPFSLPHTLSLLAMISLLTILARSLQPPPLSRQVKLWFVAAWPSVATRVVSGGDEKFGFFSFWGFSNLGVNDFLKNT